MIIKDHGFLRLCYNNFHKVDENLYRSNMPTPSRIKRYSKLGIKTIINLRGVRKDGGWLLEKRSL
jgi:protein tyrosine/serine phosphatase